MKIGIIGTGRLGLCFALNLNNSGFDVIGCDVQQSHIDSLRNKLFQSPEPFVNDLLKKTSINFTTKYKDLEYTDILFVMVNTPSQTDGSFDHKQINNVIYNLKGYTNFIVICSTVMPGYCDSLNDPRIIYSPQFVAQGNIIESQLTPDLVLIGTEIKDGANKVQYIYNKLHKNTPRIKIMSRLSAEITKLALNCYITTKISFANNLGDICKFAGVDCDEVLSAIASDSRVGDKCFSYGYGYGGPCFPRDNKAFVQFAHKYAYPFISEATEKTNKDHLLQQLKLLTKGILPNNMQIHDNTTIITGVGFKPNSKILEQSQQLELAVELTKKYKVIIRENKFVIDELKSKYGDLFDYEAI